MWRSNGFLCLSIFPLLFFLVSTPSVSVALFLRMARLPNSLGDPFTSASRTYVPFQTYPATGMNPDYKLYRQLLRRNGDDFLTDRTTSSEAIDRFHEDDTPVMEPDTSHTPTKRTPSHLAAHQVPTKAKDRVSPQEPMDHAAPEEHPGPVAADRAISEELPNSEPSGPIAFQEPTIATPTDHASPDEPTVMEPADPAAAAKESSSETLLTHEKHDSSMSHEQFPYQDSGASEIPSLHIPSQHPNRMIPQAHIPLQDPEDKRMPPFYPSSQYPARRTPPFYSPSYEPEGGRMPKFHHLSQDPAHKIPPFQAPDRWIPPSNTQFQTPYHRVSTDSGIPGEVTSQEESTNPLAALFSWKIIVSAVVDEVTKRRVGNGEIKLLDHDCNYFTRPSFVEWKIQFPADVWCPGWTTIVGRGLSTEASTSIQQAIQDFFMKSQAEGIVHPDDIKNWYNNNKNNEYNNFK